MRVFSQLRCPRPALIAAFFSLHSLSLEAGPVNTPGSYPFALMNSQGDSLSLGDQKGLFTGRGPYTSERTASLRLAVNARMFPLFSGGLASPDAWDAKSGRPFAIACSNSEAALYRPERSPAHPGGRWEPSPAAVLGAKSQPLQCTMLATGHYAWLDDEGGRLLINGTQSLRLPFRTSDKRLLALGSAFLVLSPSGQSLRAVETTPGIWSWSSIAAHPFGRFDELTRFASNENAVLRADGDRVQLARLSAEGWGPATRLPVQPCESSEACGVSLAADESWVVSGSWGHYLGRGQVFRRLEIPLSIAGSGRSFGVAFAHQGLGGRFLYLGHDDGDQGLLPAWAPQRNDLAAAGQRWLFWSHSRSGRSLFSLPLKLRSRSSGSEPELQLGVWDGPLPVPLPRDWIAWEAEQSWQAASPSGAAIAGTRGRYAEDPWWARDLGLARAEDLSTAQGLVPREIPVAVIDSGIDPDHPWLVAQRNIRSGEIPGNGLDDEGNGLVDDVWGYDFVDEDPLPEDNFGHGTHVAGLLMAARDEQRLAPAPNLRLTVIKALDRYGKSNSIDLARALSYAVASGAEIINCSWGGGADTQALRDAFAFVQRSGLLVISSAGNDRLDSDQYPEVPKKYPGVISITAHREGGTLASFANFGRRSVQWSAPGDEILSSLRGGQLGLMSGTSMAAPLFTSSLTWVLGLLKARFPERNSVELREGALRLLCSSADPRGLEARSVCGRVRLDQATERALSEEL